jgi:lipoprotein NlpD
MEKIKPSTLILIFFILSGLPLILSCFSPQIQKAQTMGVYHRVKKNETAQMIANAYQVRLQKLAEMNNAANLNSIKEGDVLFIPEANGVIDNINTNVKATTTKADVEIKKAIPKIFKNPARNQDAKKEVSPAKEMPAAVYKKDSLPDTKSSAKQQSKADVSANAAPLKTPSRRNIPEERVEPKSKLKKSEEDFKIDKNRFIWPVRGNVKTRFGLQPNKTYNNWIKIVSNAGTKVKAAASGTVIFSSELKNYGETIIIRHKNNFATVYTHLKRRYVRIDQSVKKGEIIALMAETDDTGEAYVNFEIRLQGKACNPLLFLP